jgi:hypothetical protein
MAHCGNMWLKNSVLVRCLRVVLKGKFELSIAIKECQKSFGFYS